MVRQKNKHKFRRYRAVTFTLKKDLYQTWNWVTGSPGQWVIWVIFSVWVTGSPGHHYDPVCDPAFFILKHRFVVYLMFVEYFSFSLAHRIVAQALQYWFMEIKYNILIHISFYYIFYDVSHVTS